MTFTFAILAILIEASSGKLLLSEEEAVELAIKNNPELEIFREKVKEASGLLVQAKSSFFPKIDFKGTYTYLSYVQTFTTKVLTGFKPGPGDTLLPIFKEVEMRFGEPHNYSFGISLSQPLFTWRRIMNSYLLSRSNLRSAEFELASKVEEIRYRVREAYYNALLAKEFLKLSEKVVEELRSHYESVKEKFEAGLASDFELLRAEVQYKETEPRRLKSENYYKLSLDALKILLGLELEREIELTDSLRYIEYEVKLDTLIKSAFEKRGDLLSIKEKIEMLKRRMEIEKAQDKPSLFLSLGYLYTKPYGFENRWGGMWNLSLGLSFPVFDGFKVKGAVKSSVAQLRQMMILYEHERKYAEMEIVNAYRTLETAKKVLKYARRNVQLAKRAFEMAEEQYREGLLTSLDVLDAEIAYLDARVGYLSALKDYRVAISQLEYAVRGGGQWSEGY